MSTSDGTVIGATQIVNNGPANKLWNLTLVAEGYRQSDLGQFASDAQSFVDVFFATAPFDTLKNAINVFRIDVSSTDTGADDPTACGGTGATPATYFDATYCSNAIKRLLTVNLDTARNVVKAQVPQTHQTLVIVNSNDYGGSGGAIAVTSLSTVAGGWQARAIHEIGHSYFGLADEYSTTGSNPPPGEPKEPNVTLSSDRTTIKWKDLIQPSTPVPTTKNADCTNADPQASPVPTGTVGAFEGANQFHCQVFRPEFNCKMRASAQPFCAVCQRQILERMAPFVVPAVTIINPTSGSEAGGTTVTITGSGFLAVTGVGFGNTGLTNVTINSSTQITAVSPPGTGTVDVTVITPGGTSATSSADQFTYLTATAPTVTSINPTSGPASGGTSVTVTGTGFNGATGVSFGSTAASNFTVASDTQITATSPAANLSGAVDVTVTTPNGTSATSSADQFTYITTAAPTVTGINPTSGPEAGGTTVTITGTGFTGFTGVGFGQTGATSATLDSDTQITAVSPPGSGPIDVTVVTANGTSAISSADQFTYTAASTVPTVSGLNPTSGSAAGGDSVTITGTGFTGATNVSFGSTAASSFQVDSDTQITATSPAANVSGAVDVTVTTPNGTSATASADQFSYITTGAAPAVTGINPTSGSAIGGTSVTITGTGFNGATGVSFGSTAASSFNVDSDTQITATSPAANLSGAVDVTVTTPNGTSATGSADQFTYITAAAPTVTGIDPTSGPADGGTSVTITGTGFNGATGVSFGSTAASNFTVDSDTQITATSPAANVSGAVDVTVTTPNGTSATGSADQFTYITAAAPAVTGINPTSGSAAGGDSVTITGTDFTGATNVSFGSTAASSFQVDSDTQITATSPVANVSGAVDVTVTTPNGTSATGSADQFTYM